jgi:hypothetical protein
VGDLSFRIASGLIAILLWAVPAGSSSAISVGEQDNFSLDLEGWAQGALSTPSGGVIRAEGGGPAGEGDAYMQVVADGIGDHGALVVYNKTTPWEGDYIAAGVTGVWMSVNNLGATDLNLRLAFGTSEAPREGGSWVSSTTSINVPSGSGWLDVQLPLTPADLTLVQGANSITEVMSSVAAVRILHSTTPSARGNFLSAHLGVDNILVVGALSIPGDFDNNLAVNGADLAQWRTDFGDDGGSDADADLDSDGRDLLVWQRQLGASPVVTAPEPATMAMAMGMAAIAIAWRRRLLA